MFFVLERDYVNVVGVMWFFWNVEFGFGFGEIWVDLI